MSPLELLNKKNRRLRTIPDTFLKRLNQIQRLQYDIITAKLKQLQIRGETITPSRANLLIVDELREELRENLATGEYVDAVREFSREFDKQKAVNSEYYSSLDAGRYSGEVADEVVRNIKQSTVRALIEDTINPGFLNPIENVLNTAVADGAGFAETLKYIRNFVEGDENVDGGLLRYAKQLAHDSFANADRGYSGAVADELELEFFIYAGGEVAATRCFCDKRAGKYYHYKEIEAWGRGEGLGECGFPWAGMNRATDDKTIFTYAGGYNCMHSIQGVSIFMVPPDDVQRNVDNGNYSPTEFERVELGL
jgi:hypothetical protein